LTFKEIELVLAAYWIILKDYLYGKSSRKTKEALV